MASASLLPTGAGAVAVAVELSRLPNERGADVERGSEEEGAGVALVGWIPNVKVGLVLADGAPRPKTPGDPVLTNWMLPKMVLTVVVAALVVATEGAAVSVGLLTCEGPPRGNPEGNALDFGGCAPGVLADGGLAAAALAFSSACPTLNPEKLPSVSPATGA